MVSWYVPFSAPSLAASPVKFLDDRHKGIGNIRGTRGT